MLNEQTQPMTAEEFISNNYSYSKEPLAWRLFKGSVASLMNDYANYRLAFEKEQQPKTIKGSLWYCETCKSTVDAVNVTYEETHDVRAGGCGGRVVPDPYWSDPATWPEWANWTAAHEVGVMCFYELRPVIRSYSSGCWWPGAGGRVELFRVITHNPDWRNSLRSREEVSRGK